MKKLLKVFLVVFVVSVLLGAFAACNPDCKGNHQYGEWHQTTATCTEGGIAGYYQCTVCEKYFDADHNEISKESLNIEALGHTFTSADFIEEVGATCIGNGTKGHFHCDRCGKNFAADGTTELTDLVITGGTHAFGAWVDEVPATCKDTGTKAHKDCTVCGKHFDADGNEIADLTIAVTNTHTFGAWINEVASNCSDTGTKAHKDCTICGKHFDADGNEIADLTIPVAGTHVFGAWVDEVPATCTTAGTKGHKVCSACGYNFDAEGNRLESLVIPAAHTLTKEEGTPATCTTAGELLHWHCSVCEKNFDGNNQELKSLVIAALGHTWSTTEIIAEVGATCTTAGTKAHWYCTVCEKNFDSDKTTELESLVIAAKGHTWSTTEIIAEVSATCSATGTKAHWYCSVCEKNFDSDKTTELESITIAKTTHTLTKVDAVAASCETAGNVEHWTCSVCHANFSDDKGATALESVAVDALGHNCVENVCQREGCGKTLTAQEIVDALYKLEADESLNGTYKLTGTITKVENAWSEEYKNITVVISVCDKEITCYRMKSGETADASTLAVGQEITVVGQLIYTYGKREFNTGCVLANVTVPTVTLNVPTVEHATVSKLESSYNAGTVVEFTITVDEGYKVGYVKANGEYLLADEDGKYSFAIAVDTTIEIHVVEESAASLQQVEISIATVANTLKWKNNTLYTELTGYENLTITASKGSSNNGKYWENDESWRFYQSEQGTLTISVAEGYELISIKITGKNSDSGIFDKLNGYQGTYTVKTEAEKSSVTFTVGSSSTKTAKGKVFVTGITIIYVPVADCEHKTFGEWVDEVPATCTTAGTKAHKDCTECGKHFDVDGNEIDVLEIAALGHTWSATEIIAEVSATCSATGTKAHWYCSVCEKNFDSDKTTELTSLTIEKDENSHKLQKVNAKDADCENAGNVEHWKCSDCGRLFSDVEGKNATTLDGVTVNAKGHTVTKVDAVASTCTKKGNVEHWHCSVCEANFSDQACKTPLESIEVALDANAHNWGAWTPVEGQQKHSHACTYNATHVETVDCTVGTAWETDNENHWHECSVCHAHYDQAAHDYGTTQTCECGKNIYAVNATYGENTQAFKTLVEAIAFAEENYNAETAVTITLRNNLSGDGVKVTKANVVIDLGGYTYTVIKKTVGSEGTKTNGFQLLKGSVVTFKNGTIKTVAEANAKILIQNYSDLTFDNVVLDGSAVVQGTAASGNYVSSNNFGTVTYKNGSKVIATGNDYAFDVCYGWSDAYADGVHVIVEEGCTVEGAIEYSIYPAHCGTNWSEKATLVLPEGTYTIKLGTKIELTCDAANITIGDKAYDCTYGDWSHVADTETHSRTCTRCGHVDVQNCSGGTATCTQKAQCSVCGEQWGTWAAHVIGDKVDEVPASCTEDGTKAYYPCKNCEAKFSDAEGTTVITDLVISAAHSWDSTAIHPEVSASCENAGTKAYWYCSVCKEHFDADFNAISDISIDAFGHNIIENACQRTGCDKVYSEQEVLDLLFALEKDKSLPGTYKLAGTISKVFYTWSEKNGVTFDMTVGEKTVKAHKLACIEIESYKYIVGTQVTITGGLTRYNDTYEFKQGCTASNVVPATCAISSSIENGTITGLAATYTAGQTATFTVAANSGYKVESVKVGGTAIEAAEDGSYSFVVTGALEVVVTIVDENKASNEVFATLTFPADEQETKNSYADTWSAKNSEGEWEISNFNNNNNGWSLIKTGSKSNAVEGKIKVGFVRAVTKIVMKVTLTGQGTVNSTTLYMYSDSTYKTQVGDSISVSIKTGEVEFSISKPQANLYYKIVIDCAKGSKNGFVEVSEIKYYAEAVVCDHDWGEGEVTKAATCKEAGERTFTCSKCSGTKTEEIAQLTTHTLGTVVPAKAATCTEDGNVEYYQCSVCNKYFSDAEGTTELTSVAVEALGHDFVDGTCTRQGCGATESTTQPKLTLDVSTLGLSSSYVDTSKTIDSYTISTTYVMKKNGYDVLQMKKNGLGKITVKSSTDGEKLNFKSIEVTNVTGATLTITVGATTHTVEAGQSATFDLSKVTDYDSVVISAGEKATYVESIKFYE